MTKTFPLKTCAGGRITPFCLTPLGPGQDGRKCPLAPLRETAPIPEFLQLLLSFYGTALEFLTEKPLQTFPFLDSRSFFLDVSQTMIRQWVREAVEESRPMARKNKVLGGSSGYGSGQ